MLQTFLLALGVVLVLIAAMSVGVIFGRKPISGSCGGVGSQIGGSCSVCGRESGNCEDASDAEIEALEDPAAGLAYRADSPGGN